MARVAGAPSRGAGSTFAALQSRNYRRYSGGQSVSQLGTWMQIVAQGWLVLHLSGSGAVLGPVVAAPIVGAICHASSPRVGLLLDAAACLGSTALGASPNHGTRG